MKRELCPNFVKTLKLSEVFVFGSNNQGFHAAGSAGYAQRGTAKNTWRCDKPFLAALKTGPRDEKRRGKWSWLGTGRGYQKGSEGASYGIATVTHAGRPRSIRLSEILAQLKELGEYARQHSDKQFLCCVSGGGYCGWSVKDFQGIYKQWCLEDPPPDNVLLQKDYEYRD